MSNMKPLKRFKKPARNQTKGKKAERFLRPGLIEWIKIKLFDKDSKYGAE